MKELLNKLFSVKYESIDKMTKFIYDNNLFLKNSPFKISYNDNIVAKYSFTTKEINIPQNVINDKINKKTIDDLQRYLPKKTLEFVVAHEIGHGVHHQSLKDNHNYIFIKNDENLNDFLQKDLNKNDPVEGFIHSNFAESYADCYACLAMYLQSGDGTVFTNIFNYRNNKYFRFKTSRIRFDENKKLKTFEISQGSLGISRYFAYYALPLLKKNIIESFSIESLKKMPYENLHDLIQIEVISGIYTSLVKELNDNDLFYKDMLLFLQDKGMSVSEYFNLFKSNINEMRKSHVMKITREVLMSKMNFATSENFDLSDFLNENKDFFNINEKNIILNNKNSLKNIDELKYFLREHLFSSKSIIEFANDLNFGKLITEDSIYKRALNKEIKIYVRKNMNFHISTAMIKNRVVDIDNIKEKINSNLLNYSNDLSPIFKKYKDNDIKSIYLLVKHNETTLPLFISLEKFKKICQNFFDNKIIKYIRKTPKNKT